MWLPRLGSDRPLQEHRPLFANKVVFIAINKVDITRPEDLSPEMQEELQGLVKSGEVAEILQLSCNTQEGVQEAKNAACERLIAERVSQKLKAGTSNTGAIGGRLAEVMARIHVAQPMGGETRETFIPEAIKNLKKYDKNDPERRVLAKDIEVENGGAGVFNVDLRADYILDNPEWKYDRVPEVFDGQNVYDYIDPEIDAKLEELEKEEERLQEEGYYDEDEELTDEEDRKALEDAEVIREKIAMIRNDARLKKRLKNRPIMPRSKTKRNLSEMDEALDVLGVDTSRFVPSMQEGVPPGPVGGEEPRGHGGRHGPRRRAADRQGAPQLQEQARGAGPVAREQEGGRCGGRGRADQGGEAVQAQPEEDEQDGEAGRGRQARDAFDCQALGTFPCSPHSQPTGKPCYPYYTAMLTFLSTGGRESVVLERRTVAKRRWLSSSLPTTSFSLPSTLPPSPFSLSYNHHEDVSYGIKKSGTLGVFWFGLYRHGILDLELVPLCWESLLCPVSFCSNDNFYTSLASLDMFLTCQWFPVIKLCSMVNYKSTHSNLRLSRFHSWRGNIVLKQPSLHSHPPPPSHPESPNYCSTLIPSLKPSTTRSSPAQRLVDILDVVRRGLEVARGVVALGDEEVVRGSRPRGARTWG